MVYKVFLFIDKGSDENEIESMMGELFYIEWSWKESLFVITHRDQELINTAYFLWVHICHMFSNVLDSM